MREQSYIPALGYHFLSGYYDITIKMTMPEKKIRQNLLDMVVPLPGDNILEFGFGTAQNLILLKEQYPDASVQGVDIDPQIESIARRKLEARNMHIPLILYDGRNLPFRQDSFDKVFSSLVFHQLDGETKMDCLKEIHRIMKPGGKLVVGDWGRAKSRWMRFSFYAVQLLDGFGTTEDNVKGLMPQFIFRAGFGQISEAAFVNTAIGTFSFYTAYKND